MVIIPGSVPAPMIPPTPPKKKEESVETQKSSAPSRSSLGRDAYELDSRGIAVRMAALAMDAKEKELSFEEIIEKVIKETGLTGAQSAMEEANRRIQKEIEEEIDKIKKNKALMEEAYAWQELADLLEKELTEEQVGAFISMLESEIKSAK